MNFEETPTMEAKECGLQFVQVKRIPRLLGYLQECPLIDDFTSSELVDQTSHFDTTRQFNVLPSGIPLYLARSSKPPTSCITPGHTIPSGYTPSGKYKTSKYVPSKMDKRGGK